MITYSPANLRKFSSLSSSIISPRSLPTTLNICQAGSYLPRLLLTTKAKSRSLAPVTLPFITDPKTMTSFASIIFLALLRTSSAIFPSFSPDILSFLVRTPLIAPNFSH